MATGAKNGYNRSLNLYLQPNTVQTCPNLVLFTSAPVVSFEPLPPPHHVHNVHYLLLQLTHVSITSCEHLDTPGPVFPHTYSVLSMSISNPHPVYICPTWSVLCSSASTPFCLHLPYPVLCAPVPTRSCVTPLIRSVYLPKSRPVHICLHPMLWTSRSTYMPLLMHCIISPPPCGALPKPYPYFLAPILSYIPLHIPRPVYLCPYPPCVYMPQRSMCISTLPYSLYPIPHPALCISMQTTPCVNLPPTAPVLCTTSPSLFTSAHILSSGVHPKTPPI